MPIKQAWQNTAAGRLEHAQARWQREPAPDPLSRIKGSKGRPIKRQKPVNVNLPPMLPKGGIGIPLESVGDGFPVLLPYTETDSRNNEIRSIKNVGSAAAIFVDPEDASKKVLEARSLKPKDGFPITITEQGNVVEFDGPDASDSAEINIDGRIEVVKGIVTNLVPGERGKDGALYVISCDDSDQSDETGGTKVLEWIQGQILTEGRVPIHVGECHTGSSGP